MSVWAVMRLREALRSAVVLRWTPVCPSWDFIRVYRKACLRELYAQNLDVGAEVSYSSFPLLAYVLTGWSAGCRCHCRFGGIVLIDVGVRIREARWTWFLGSVTAGISTRMPQQGWATAGDRKHWQAWCWCDVGYWLRSNLRAKVPTNDLSLGLLGLPHSIGAGVQRMNVSRKLYVGSVTASELAVYFLSESWASPWRFSWEGALIPFPLGRNAPVTLEGEHMEGRLVYRG